MSSRVNEVSGENLQDPPIKNPGYANARNGGENQLGWHSYETKIAPQLRYPIPSPKATFCSGHKYFTLHRRRPRYWQQMRHISDYAA